MSIVDTTYPSAVKLTINVSIDVEVPPTLFAGSWGQVDFDAAYFNSVVARLITNEARCQYTACVAKLRSKR